MDTRMRMTTGLPVVLVVALAGTAAGCARPEGGSTAQAEAELCAQRLAAFDTLDYDVFTHQKWDRLGESHAATIVVTWPDGRETTGLETHVADLKALFSYAPNTAIREHPIRICQGDYTAVTGVMTGTFSQPLLMGDRTIPPTGKSFQVTMTTIGHWVGNTMDHEWLFWDNQTFMRQIGLGQ